MLKLINSQYNSLCCSVCAGLTWGWYCVYLERCAVMLGSKGEAACWLPASVACDSEASRTLRCLEESLLLLLPRTIIGTRCWRLYLVVMDCLDWSFVGIWNRHLRVELVCSVWVREHMQAVDPALGVDSPWFLQLLIRIAIVQSAGRVLSLLQLSHWRIALVISILVGLVLPIIYINISLLDLHHIQVDSEGWIALMGSSILFKQLHSVYIRAWREREASSHRGLLISQQSILLGTLSFQDPGLIYFIFTSRILNPSRATDPSVNLILLTKRLI